MLEILFFPLWIGYGVLIYKVKHRMFTVYYAPGGFSREIGMTIIAGFILAKVTVEILSEVWPFIVGVLILLAVGVVIFNKIGKKEITTEQEEKAEE